MLSDSTIRTRTSLDSGGPRTYASGLEVVADSESRVSPSSSKRGRDAPDLTRSLFDVQPQLSSIQPTLHDTLRAIEQPPSLHHLIPATLRPALSDRRPFLLRRHAARALGLPGAVLSAEVEAESRRRIAAHKAETEAQLARYQSLKAKAEAEAAEAQADAEKRIRAAREAAAAAMEERRRLRSRTRRRSKSFERRRGRGRCVGRRRSSVRSRRP